MACSRTLAGENPQEQRVLCKSTNRGGLGERSGAKQDGAMSGVGVAAVREFSHSTG